MIDQIVNLRKTLSTKAKPRLTMSFSKGNNLIYHPLNHMLFNLLCWMFSLSRLQWCFFFHFNVSFHIQSIHFYRCSIILLESRILNHPALEWQIYLYSCIYKDKYERVTVKKLLPAEPCVRAECYPRLI